MIDTIRLLQSYNSMICEFQPDPRIEGMICQLNKPHWVSQLLKEVVRALMMEPLELTVWAIYMDRFVWTRRFLMLKDMLFITAYAAKTYLNEHKNTQIFQAFLSEKVPRFIYMYNSWVCKVNLACLLYTSDAADE